MASADGSTQAVRRAQSLRPEHKVVVVQLVVTLAAMLLAAYLAGVHGAISVALGGGVSMASVLVFSFLARPRPGSLAGEVIYRALRAEAGKIAFVVVALWLILALYKSVVVVGLIGAFIVAVLISTFAFFVRTD